MAAKVKQAPRSDKEKILDALERTRGAAKPAAKLLGVSRNTLLQRMRREGIPVLPKARPLKPLKDPSA